MATFDRVTVTLPSDLVRDIDRQEKNRSKFVAEAVRHELERRRRLEFRKSLQNPHPATIALANQPLTDWVALPEEDIEGMLDMSAGVAVEWVDGKGWVERK